MLPKVIIACVGGGSNSIGLFTDFINEHEVDIFGVEGGGKGLDTGLHVSAICNNKIRIMHGMKTFVMQNNEEGELNQANNLLATIDGESIDFILIY